ncbi:MAG: Tryptophan halogenase [uncultured Sphingomonadaceae bacterium]|uniref:Tryptophan halogenase n=1 Tax=uncultured Sphingomonadaceae bacterium TaxID=169976 RepID=A0A6J4RZ12_9SPHN|nr:MAG: Tryptophan halogenase [uncultured Sphingomonadaceae bacterium]
MLPDMTDRPNRVKHVVVAGGGIVGWSAAATIRKRLPGLSVTVVALPPPPDALADRMSGTLPSIIDFHADLGIDEAHVVARTGSGFRLGSYINGWAEGMPPYFNGYGEHGRQLGTAPFHQFWLREANGARADFTAFSPSAAIALSGRFAHPPSDPTSPIPPFGYGLQLNSPAYRDYMRAYALHLGATERSVPIRAVRRRGDGFIEAVALADGSAIAGDLFIDCTGPSALLGAEQDKFEEWSQWLPCDRLLLAEAPPPAEFAPFDTVTALPAGWRWQAASPARTSHGLAYSSAHLSDGKAERILRGATGVSAIDAPVKLRSGRRTEPWVRNCVAIGDSAVALEPLESVNLHLAHSALDRLVAMLPDRDCAPVELAEYNRQSAAEADRVRDFLVLHYHLAHLPKQPFWREVAAVQPPASLAHTLELFRERGTLPFYEEETFARDSWLAVLFGQGVRPRRTDPLTDAVPPELAARAMTRMRETIAAIVPTLPTHTAYVRDIARRASR